MLNVEITKFKAPNKEKCVRNLEFLQFAKRSPSLQAAKAIKNPADYIIIIIG